MSWTSFYKIYESLEGERLARYNAAEEIYFDRFGKYWKQDFRMFQAKLILENSKKEPHFSTANEKT